jgi:hypothetical protein
MQRRILTNIALVVATMAFTTIFHPFQYFRSLAQPAEQTGCRQFTETGQTVCGRFLDYWNTHGGLAQQGYPVSPEFTEVSDLDGKSYTVQYFERAVFEYHPENKAPYDVLLSQLGTFRLKEKYPNGTPANTSPPPQPTSAPADGLVGQVFEYTPLLQKTTFKAEVSDTKESVTIPKGNFWQEQKAKGKFVIVFFKISNTGKEPGTFYGSDFRLQDSQGRSFDIASDWVVQTAAAGYYNVNGIGHDLQPGFTEDFVLVFDVPADASGYMLIRH